MKGLINRETERLIGVAIEERDKRIEELERENEALRKQCDEWRADYNRRLGCPEEIVREFSSRAGITRGG